MKIAVLSDIHGNSGALGKCIEYALACKADKFLFLGDYVGELAFPQKTMEIIYQLKEGHDCDFVKGNKEDYWINYRNGGQKGWKEQDSTTGSLLYTYRNLTDPDLDFFAGLPIAKTIHVAGMPPFTICHGSPRKVNEKMGNNESTYGLMEADGSGLILCGHTHVQGRIDHEGRRVLNPGSVGVALGCKGQAQFLLLEAVDNEWEERFISLDYDVDGAIEDIHLSGLDRMAPCWADVTIHLLKTGQVTHGDVLAKAMELCRNEEGECSWPEIPETYWERAVSAMIG